MGYFKAQTRKKSSTKRVEWKGMYLIQFTDNDLGLELFQYLTIKFEVKDIPPFIVMKTAQQTLQFGWLASQADMLATYWVDVE